MAVSFRAQDEEKSSEPASRQEPATVPSRPCGGEPWQLSEIHALVSDHSRRLRALEEYIQIHAERQLAAASGLPCSAFPVPSACQCQPISTGEPVRVSSWKESSCEHRDESKP